ncbi:MAG: 2,3-bisphosphoglycerate-independent phosphoglycerate mutase [Bacillota bacterium]|nr:2,3-bisphosphoglycerate-independent phosphoglycerate mutase [Bacillota bacterium]
MHKDITALIIMDGFGVGKSYSGNAISLSGTKNLTKLAQEYPNTTIKASGLAVGLPEGQMGNSEVGHLNIGAGRIVYQELTRISKSISDGDFFTKKEFLAAIENVKKNGSKLHLIGLLSDGGVHSHIEHLLALIKLAKRQGLAGVYVHCLMDGRDVPPTSGKGYIEQLEGEMKRMDFGKIATVMGRYYAMDRDNRWERVKLAYEAIAAGRGIPAEDAAQGVQESYDADETDEFIKPRVVMREGKPAATIENADSIIFFNFRPDRAREITRSFIEPDFSYFERAGGYKPVFYVSMTQYDKTFTNLSVAFKPQELKNTLGEYLSNLGKTQLRIAETEKYAHVTFFFSGGVEKPYKGEDRCLIPSPRRVATYDLKPSMSAYEVADEAVKSVDSGKYDFMVLNFANCDMVGHTGVLEATIEAVNTVDACVGRVAEAVLSNGGRCIITADHGNAETMAEDDGSPITAHSTNPVPFILVDDAKKNAKLRSGGILADIAPTLLDMMGLPKPAEMTGKSLLELK